jgi:hypothetical protein
MKDFDNIKMHDKTIKMILVDASKPGRLVSGREASDKNYFRVG